MIDVIVSAGVVNMAKLDADIRAALGTAFVGLSQGKDRSRLTLHFDAKASAEDMATAQSMVLSHDPLGKTLEQQMLDSLRTTAASAAGVALADLTAGQRNALMAVLLWKAGGIGKDGTIKPLSEWVR